MNTHNDVKDFFRKHKFAIPEQLVEDVKSSDVATTMMDCLIEAFGAVVSAMDTNSVDQVAKACAELRLSLEGLELSLGVDPKEEWNKVINRVKQEGTK